MAVTQQRFTCGVCSNSVSEEDYALECEGFCSSWFHHKCVKISKKDYDQISRLGEKIRWFCGPCDARMQTVISSDCDLKNLLVTGFNELKEAVNSVCKVQENTKKKLSNIVTHHVKLSTNINLIAKQCGLKAEATSRADDADDTSPSNVMEKKNENNLPLPVSDDNCTASFSDNDLQSSATIANDVSMAVMEPYSPAPSSDLTMTTNFSLAHVGVGTPVCSRVEVEDTCKNKNTANCDVFSAGEVRKPEMNGDITYASALKNPQKPKLGRDIPGVIGTNVKTTLKSVGKQEWLFISRLQPSTTTMDVSNFLTSEGIQNVECTELKSVADDVGGWRRYSIDPEVFSSFLMRMFDRHVSLGCCRITEPTRLLACSYELLRDSSTCPQLRAVKDSSTCLQLRAVREQAAILGERDSVKMQKAASAIAWMACKLAVDNKFLSSFAKSTMAKETHGYGR
ncbi:uncharacterized protein LOC128984815 [Macrosteles quadrilineatus]|uniref:uncharacterized protein LOC128984815 n=1 Tax=Macrosteles quadrilineatus TaxID=74068 RepID=UPI0023E23278|nr:uncharacterized protein LOC128984815 [Macrosteles quadrilineatus]